MEPSTGSKAGDVPGRHSVWGRVIDANANGIPGAEVYWVSAEHAGQESVPLHETHWVALADAEGRFWAPGLPGGPCLLVPDFRRVGVQGDRIRLTHAQRVELPLPDGEFVLPLPFSGRTFATVMGRVYDELDKTPVVGHLLAILDPEGGTTFKREVLTGADGSFGFGLLPPGKYVFAVFGTERHLEGANPIELAGGSTAKLQIGLHRRPTGPRHTVRVRVEDELGLPVAGAPVQFVAPNFQTLIVAANDEGVAEATLPVRPTTVMVGVLEFSPRGVFVPAGDPGVPVEVTISLQHTVPLRVVVRDAETGKPLRRANVSVSHGGGDYWSWGGVLPPPGAPEKDHVDAVVLPGRVTVRAETPGYEGAEREIDVSAGTDEPTAVLDLVRRSA